MVNGDPSPRWICWFVSMIFFCDIVYELLVGLASATAQESDPEIRSKVQTAQVMTVINWCTYPVVDLFPMLGINAAQAVVAIRVGYCASDIISNSLSLSETASTGYISESSHASAAAKAVEFCGPGKLIVSRMTCNQHS